MRKCLSHHVLAVLGATSLLGLLPAQAAYLDDGSGPASNIGSVERPVLRPSPGGPEQAVHRLVRDIRVGRPYHYRFLTIYPLLLDRPDRNSGVRTLDEALSQKWIEIQEKADAQVNELRVRNTSDHPVFLMAGEIVAGGKQNRMVRDDVLLPPRSDFINVPVYCGERDRWTATPEVRFSSPRFLADQTIRMKAASGASQDAIWAQIGEHSSKMSVSSPTRDYKQIYEEPAVLKQLEECADHFRDLCSTETAGAVMVSGNRIISADLFSDPKVFSRLWGKIVQAYGMDYLLRKERDECRLGETNVRDFLDRALFARYNEQYTPGTGSLLVISGGVSGSAMVWGGQAAHAALFNRDEIRPLPEPQPPYPVPMPHPLIER